MLSPFADEPSRSYRHRAKRERVLSALLYFELAVDSGFEAGVSNDPLWWKRS